MNTPQAYPLQWPAGWPRTESTKRERGAIFKTSLEAVSAIALAPQRSIPPDFIVARYRQKAMRLHPDKGGDKEQFIELQNAFEEAKRVRGFQ